MYRCCFSVSLLVLMVVFVFPEVVAAQSAEAVLNRLKFTKLYAWRTAGMPIDCQFKVEWGNLDWNKSWGAYRIVMDQWLPSGWKYPVYKTYDRKHSYLSCWNCYDYHGGSKVRLSIMYNGKRYGGLVVAIRDKPKGFHPTQLRLQPYELYRMPNGTFEGRLAVINLSNFPYEEQGTNLYRFHVMADYYNASSKWANKWTDIASLSLKAGKSIPPRRSHVFDVKLANKDWQKNTLPPNISKLRYQILVNGEPNKGWKVYKTAYAKVTKLSSSQEAAYKKVRYAKFHDLKAWKTIPGGRGGASFSLLSGFPSNGAQHVKIFMEKLAKVKVGSKVTGKWLSVGTYPAPTAAKDYTKSFMVGNATQFRAYFRFLNVNYGMKKVSFKVTKAGRATEKVSASKKVSKPSIGASPSRSTARSPSARSSLGVRSVGR